MPWWVWTLIGVVIYIVISVIVLAVLKGAGDEDERMGRK
jgi:uncharacterized membrane protein SirB2